MKRVIFILLICALLLHLRAWALEDVTTLKEEGGSKSQQTSSEDLTDLIKKLEDSSESIRQEAKKQLLDIIWQGSVRSLVHYENAEYNEEKSDILLSDIDGNGTREIITSFSNVWIDGYIQMSEIDDDNRSVVKSDQKRAIKRCHSSNLAHSSITAVCTRQIVSKFIQKRVGLLLVSNGKTRRKK